jgi:hypothetical protein
MNDDRAVPPERYFGAVTIEGKRCSTRGCSGVPEAAILCWTRQDPQLSVVWLCAEHAAATVAAAGGNDGSVAYVERTCGQEVGGVPCGGFATHLAVIRVQTARSEQLLRLVSVCDRHIPGYE